MQSCFVSFLLHWKTAHFTQYLYFKCKKLKVLTLKILFSYTLYTNNWITRLLTLWVFNKGTTFVHVLVKFQMLNLSFWCTENDDGVSNFMCILPGIILSSTVDGSTNILKTRAFWIIGFSISIALNVVFFCTTCKLISLW